MTDDQYIQDLEEEDLEEDEIYFDFDLERMKLMVESAEKSFTRVPDNVKTGDEVLDWLYKQ